MAKENGKVIHGEFQVEYAKATMWIALNKGLFAQLMYALVNEVSTGVVPTAVTSGVKRYFDKTFMDGQNYKQQAFVMAHEIMHEMLQHKPRCDRRDHELWNIACVSAESLVSTPNGYIAAGYLDIGDTVCTPFGDQPVVGVKHSEKIEYMELDMDYGYKLVCTPDHLILTEDGYVRADCIEEKKTRVFVEARGDSVSEGQLGAQVHKGYCEGSGVVGETGVLKDGAIAGVRGPHDAKAAEPERGPDMDARAVGVLSRSDRRGGVSGSTGNKEQEEWEHIHSSDSPGEQYVVRSGEVDGNAGHVLNCAQEQYREDVLDDKYIGKTVRGFRAGYSSVCENPSAQVRHTAGGNSGEGEAEAARPADSIHHVACRGAEGFELVRVNVSRRIRASRNVVDITTPVQCFIASGVVVHNCDIKINNMLLQCGFERPTVGVFDYRGEAFHNKSEEFIYDFLEEEQEKGNQVVPKGYEGDLVGDDMTPDQIAQAVGRLQNAVEMHGHGNLPAELQGAINAILQPKDKWYDTLRRYFINKSFSGCDWTSMCRREYARTGLVAPPFQSDSLGVVVISVDQSGSISQEILNHFAGHINSILMDCKPERVVVQYFDTVIHDVDEFKVEDLPINLRHVCGGGTDFNDIITKADDYEAVVHIILTDCEAPTPTASTTLPTIWADFMGGHSAPFGEYLHIEME